VKGETEKTEAKPPTPQKVTVGPHEMTLEEKRRYEAWLNDSTEKANSFWRIAREQMGRSE
jgi:hypothetical protein